jgi:rare lipoprotein A
VRVEARAPVALLAAAAVASITFGCGSAEGARGKAARIGKVERGTASYYGKGFVGKKTASGERFDPKLMTAAHPKLPLGTRVKVTRTDGNRASVTVRARKLDMIKVGVVPVRLEVVK